MNILITGGTGKTGKRVAHLLTEAGQPIRVATRHSSPRFDWYDQSTWDPVLEGCTAAYLAFQPDLGLPGADEIIAAFAQRAVAHNCRRLVLLSGRGEKGARKSERALAESGADWTILRSAFFMQNFTESFFADEIAHGSLTMLGGSIGEPFIDAHDIAAVAVTALLDPAHTGRIHELTGPALLTFEQIAQQIAAATGRIVTYRGLPLDDYVGHLIAGGLPEDVASGLAYLFDEVLDGRNAHVDDGVASVLGRAPRNFHDFLTSDLAHADATHG